MWTFRAAALLLLSAWYWPPVVAVLLLLTHPIWWPLVLGPTVFVLVAIAFGNPKLPRWAWEIATPDSPTTPYWQWEPSVKGYYRFGRIIGDYLWFAWRNQLNGMALAWGFFPNFETDKFQQRGDANVGHKDATGRWITGRYNFDVYRKGEKVAWVSRGTVSLGRVVFIWHFGYAWLEGFYLNDAATRAAQKIIPPAEIKITILPRFQPS